MKSPGLFKKPFFMFKMSELYYYNSNAYGQQLIKELSEFNEIEQFLYSTEQKSSYPNLAGNVNFIGPQLDAIEGMQSN